MTGEERALSMLGLCMRAGFVRSGEAACEQLVKRGGARLLLVDAGASQGARKAMLDACQYANVPMFALRAGALGEAIGKPGRMAAAVADAGFAANISKLLTTEQTDAGVH